MNQLKILNLNLKNSISLILFLSIVIGILTSLTQYSQYFILGIALVFLATVLLFKYVNIEKLFFLYIIYIPFEEFVVKWLPNSLYLIVKYGSELAIYFIAVYVMALKISNKKKVKINKIDLLVILIICSIFLSSIFGITNFSTSLISARSIIRYAAIYIIIRSFGYKKEMLYKFVNIAIILYFIQVGITLIEGLIGPSAHEFLKPASVQVGGDTIREGTIQPMNSHFYAMGTLGRYNLLGNFLVYFLIMTIVLNVIKPSKRKYLIITSGFVALALTNSRMSLISLILVLLLIPFIFKGKMLKQLFISLIVLTLCSPLLLVINEQKDSILDRFQQGFSKEYITQSSQTDRVYVMTQVLPKIINHSPLLGMGPGALNSYVTLSNNGLSAGKDLTAASLLNIPEYQFRFVGDVGFVSVIFQYGLIGWVLFSMLLLTAIKLSYDVYVKNKNSLEGYIYIGFSLILISILIQNLFSYNLTYRITSFYMWILIGFISNKFNADRGNNRC